MHVFCQSSGFFVDLVTEDYYNYNRWVPLAIGGMKVMVWRPSLDSHIFPVQLFVVNGLRNMCLDAELRWVNVSSRWE